MGKTVEKILLDFDPETDNLLPALKKISAAFSYVSEKDAQKVAEYFNISLSKVYETASFYDKINIKKHQDLLIQVCSGANCAVNGSFAVVREIENYFKIKADDNSDPKIKLETISCLGKCGEGPVVIVSGEIFANVTISSIHGILEKWL